MSADRPAHPLSAESEPSFPEKMRTLALTHGRGIELLQRADQLDAAIASGSVPKLIGTWAKARRLWCELTGEALI